MKRVPFIEQMEHSECGLACLAMVLGYHGYHISLSDLREEFGVPKGGFSFLHISEMSKKYNLESKAFKSSGYLPDNITNPVILFWENKHFIVLEKRKNQKYTIVDPAVGRKTLSQEEFYESYSGVLLTFNPNENFNKNKKTNSFLFLLSYVSKHPRLMISILSISLILQVLGICLPLLTKWLTDNVLLARDINQLNKAGIAVIAILLSFKILNFGRGWAIAKLQTQMDRNMMTQFMQHLFNLPYSFFENRSNGELLFRANSHIYIRQVLSTKLITFFIDGVLLFSYGFLMITLSSKLAMLVIGVGIVLFLSLTLTTGITHKITNKDVANQSKVQKVLTESIYGISDVKVMGLEEKFLNEWKEEFNEQLQSSEKRSIWNTILNILPSTIQFGLPISILWIGGYAVINNNISLGTLIAFNTLALSFINPISSIGLGYSEIISLKSYIQRLYDVIKSKSEFDCYDQEKIRTAIRGEIEFKNVSFRYDHFSEDVLKDLNFKVNIGEKVAIVGNSGSGKSTIAKLLLGLYKPTKGEIFYDQISTKNLDIKYLRRQIGTLLQETRLFNKPIIDNINMYDRELSEEQILSACDRADILKDILSCPLGFQTIISEMGANFSGGQRQRLALSRALIKEPSILVLDEATSALDNMSEHKIDESISKLDCTRIIIAHRLSTIINADRILVLDKGKIVEEGDHESLINRKGYYFNLYNASNKVGATEMIV
ncbi:peptidase domain-containing ABC transporter [Priestia megaterium]|uniref:peptidase domain-containing ABC transporter n=1 Tax=Priestia megaterium TaxID=1404 RepID=UPI0025711C98|nr:peptidase domain-containing ABC transporter [Priestia megaterium]WJD83665.1 peptidase domain-containing ABC transporter [Priestia megaterium]